MPRLTAWTLLRSGSPTPLREVDDAARARGLEPRDRALLRRIVGTEVRRRGTLRALVRHFSQRKPSSDLAAHLHVAFVQAFFMDRVPDHALVSESLLAVRATNGPSGVRAVHAILGQALRARREGRSGDPRRDLEGRELHLEEPFLRDPAEHPLLWIEDALSIPAALAKRWVARHGEATAIALARAALDEPPLSLRATTSGAREALGEELRAAGCTPRPGLHADMLLVPPEQAEAALASAAFREGRASVQGESALRAAEAVLARPGERVLDLCAAPGGKTAVLAAAGAQVSACDPSPERLERVSGTLERLGLAQRVELVRADGREGGAGDFDAVLVDAPCTNTGVLAARPEARWRFGPATRRELATLQAELLRAGAARARPGGRLVWSTCSLEPEENRRQVDAFLAEHSGWSLEEDAQSLPDPATDRERGAGPVDGGYWARLRRAPASG
jgi:16S rRNA (cytosine967-C5)-methyltransferase